MSIAWLKSEVKNEAEQYKKRKEKTLLPCLPTHEEELHGV
jgi:hypothetical protein